MFIKVRRRLRFMILLKKHQTLALYYKLDFCIVCHTKLRLSVQVLLGLHHCIHRPNY